jgi:hypothetical protein
MEASCYKGGVAGASPAEGEAENGTVGAGGRPPPQGLSLYAKPYIAHNDYFPRKTKFLTVHTQHHYTPTFSPGFFLYAKPYIAHNIYFSRKASAFLIFPAAYFTTDIFTGRKTIPPIAHNDY